MNLALSDPEILPLIHGLKPYLGVKGQVLSDSISSVLQLLSSQHGQQAVQTLNQVMSTWGQDGKMISFGTPLGEFSFSLNAVFILFLILVLLLLAGNSTFFNSNSVNNTQDENVSSEP